jgi:hypothetical protein
MSKFGGAFSDINKEMEEDLHQDPTKTWMIESHVEVRHRFGSSSFILHFYDDKSICIYDYKVNRPNASNLSDIQFLKHAISGVGWKKLYPYHSEVDKNIDFWKSLWETGIVEYDKFEKIYSR